MLAGTLEIGFCEIGIKIKQFSYKKIDYTVVLKIITIHLCLNIFVKL